MRWRPGPSRGMERIMAEQRYNPNDLELLISRSIDETLTTEERARLDHALADSAELRALAERYRAVHALLGRFAAAEPETSASFAPSVEESLRSSAPAHHEDDLAGVDHLLNRYARAEARVDWDSFNAAVLREIAPNTATVVARPRFSRHKWLKFAAPLAAAAVLGFAALYWNARPTNVVHVVEDSRSSTDGSTAIVSIETTTTPASEHDPAVPVERVADVSFSRVATVSRVSFGREPSPDWSPAGPRREVGFASVSAGRPPRAADAGPF